MEGASSDPRHTELVQLHDITHAYSIGVTQQTVLRNVSLFVPSGQSCAIVGASGSGKSTLLNIIGLLDKPSSGHIHIAGQNMTHASADTRAIARNRIIGFIFQSFNLLPRLNALDNVALPLLYRGSSRNAAYEAARVQLGRVGLAKYSHHRPAELSGGQRQRVAIARALVGNPSLLLADEPTGNLDSVTANEIIDLLLALNHEQAVTLVMVTHDLEIASRMQRCICVQDGCVLDASNA